MRPSPPVCSSQNSALPSLIAALLLIMVPPVRFGTPTDESGARSPSARAAYVSVNNSPSASTDNARPLRARGRLLQRDRLWPVSIERPPATCGGFTATRARLEIAGEKQGRRQ